MSDRKVSVSKISSLSLESLKYKLRTEGVCLRTGDFVSRICSPITSVAEGIASMYGEYPFLEDCDFADFHICLRSPTNIRRFFRRQVLFYIDGFPPFKPLGIDQAFPFLEWGLNWCVTAHTHNHLIIHAAVVEKNGRALIMPGEPGAGKSTLCAALINRGWRLLSDELTMVSLQDGAIIPLPRPVSLKNESIEVIRSFSPEAVISRIAHDTLKGSVAHMRVPALHVERVNEPARPAWIVFPKYSCGSELKLVPVSKGHGTIRLISNAFNFSILGKKGFKAVTTLVDQSDCFDFTYSKLDDAIAAFDSMALSLPPLDS